VEAELRQSIKNLEEDLKDQKATIKKIQPKFLQALNDRGRFESERDAARSRVKILTERLDARNAEVSKLKEVTVALKIELTTVRSALANSSVPEAAELAKAQAEINTLQADKERLEKRISTMQRDFEFTRESYQKASSAAAELGNELSVLNDEKNNLRRKASENMIRIAEIQRSNETKEREARIEELEAQLKDRELELWKKHEELKARTNGRRETRGTSVPQSPRMGSGTLSPRPQYMRPASGSRQNSPAPGEVVRDGYRDPILLPQSVPRGARWEHLM
jgi:chromosome segregation ATPase